jgi:hypothetical protein
MNDSLWKASGTFMWVWISEGNLEERLIGTALWETAVTQATCGGHHQQAWIILSPVSTTKCRGLHSCPFIISCLSSLPFVFSSLTSCIIYCSLSWINMSVTKHYILVTCSILLLVEMSVNCHWSKASVYFVFTIINLRKESDLTPTQLYNSVASLAVNFKFTNNCPSAHQPRLGRG